MLDKQVIDNMQHIVDNCMGEDNAACVTKCPMHCDAKAYIKLIGENKGYEAIAKIRETLFLPGVLGRICAHPCESSCRRRQEDDPLAIAKLKRYAADNFDSSSDWDLTKASPTFKKVAVIGSGPAGAQAALHLIRQGHFVTIFEKDTVVGGAMRTGIPEYRLSRDVIDSEYSYLKKLEVSFKLGVEVGVDISFDELCTTFDAVVVAVGRRLGNIDTSLSNYDSPYVHSAVDFLRSVSLTQSCDNIGKTITIIGGGDVAMDCARSALRLKQVEKVHLVCLHKELTTMAASTLEITEALEEGVEFHLASGIQKIIVENNKITKLALHRCICILDENKRFAPKFDDTDIINIETNSVIFAVGQQVDSSFDTSSVLEKKPNGTFQANPLTLQTSKENVFIAGDCASSVIVISAMAEGRKAGISVDRFLREKDIKADRDVEAEESYESKLFLPTEYLPDNWDLAEKRKQIHSSIQDSTICITNFNEVDQVYTKEEAEKEANRCLQCECKLCMKECLMLSKYTSCPKTLFKEYLDKGYANLEPKIAFSCHDCTQCTLRCPHDFDIHNNFIAIRTAYIEKRDGYSDYPGHIALDDGQELECSKKYCTSIITKKRPKYVFIPGCTVPASLPEETAKVSLHLSEMLGEEVSSILRCCGRPTEMIRQMDVFSERYDRVQQEIEELGAETIITVCPSCYKTYDKYSGKKMISYWDLMKDQIGIPKSQKGVGINSDIIFNIHDPCVTRHMHTHQESIRWMLDELGYKYEEMKYHKTNTRCCSVGGMQACVDPELAAQYIARRMEDATQDHILTYCGSCRGSMEKGGKDGVHILELLFRPTIYMKSDAHIRGNNYGFHNRMDTKKRFIKIREALKLDK